MGTLLTAGVGAMVGSGALLYLDISQRQQDPDWKCFMLSVGIGTIVGAATTMIISKICSRRSKQGSKPKFSTPMKVYHSRTHRSSRVAWFIEELGVKEDFEFIHYDPYTEPEDRKEWYMTNVHPHGTVPAMVTPDGAIMVEGAAIVLYLADLYQKLLPPDSERPHYYSWSVYAVATLDACIRIIYRQLYVVPKEERDKHLIENRSKKYDEFAAALEKHLGARDYICGKQFTTADVCMGYSVMWASIIKGGVMLQDYPRTKAYLARLKTRPAFQKELGTAREWLTSLPPP